MSLEFSEVISDMAVEQDAEGKVFLVMSQPMSGVLVYSFNGHYLHFHQVTCLIKRTKAINLKLIIDNL